MTRRLINHQITQPVTQPVNGRHALGPTRAHGFVLPVVILLIVLVGVSSSIMLQRHIARSKTVERQLRSYQEHHGSRSIQAVVEAWLKTPTARPREIGEMLEADGLAFTVDTGDGTTINIHLFPGQGTMLTRVTGVAEQDREQARLAVALLQGIVRDELDYRRRTRPVGPLGVDPNNASIEVLIAIVRAVLGDSPGASQYEGLLTDAVQRGDAVTLQSLANFATEASIEADKRSQLSRFLTITPDLWRFRVDQFGSPVVGRPLLGQYRGLLLLGSTTVTSGNTFEQPPPFLSWESVDLDDPLAVE